jgi:hypothetical protein
MAAVHPEPWLWALITNNNNNTNNNTTSCKHSLVLLKMGEIIA